jgi:hypothetical protein
MAGSYNHIVDDEGKIHHSADIYEMLDTPGDMIEAIEEMYGMIWALANGNPHRVKWAQENWKLGVELSSPGWNTQKSKED